MKQIREVLRNFFLFGLNDMVLQVFEVSNRIHLIHSAALLGVPLTRRPALVSTQYFNLKGQSQKMASAFVVFRNVSEVLVKQYSSLICV